MDAFQICLQALSSWIRSLTRKDQGNLDGEVRVKAKRYGVLFVKKYLPC